MHVSDFCICADMFAYIFCMYKYVYAYTSGLENLGEFSTCPSYHQLATFLDYLYIYLHINKRHTRIVRKPEWE